MSQQTKGRVKNPCRICNLNVDQKGGVQCKGACARWAHYKCLGFSPKKILDIRDGVIEIVCPCPHCNLKQLDDALFPSTKVCDPIGGFCPTSREKQPRSTSPHSPRKQSPRRTTFSDDECDPSSCDPPCTAASELAKTSPTHTATPPRRCRKGCSSHRIIQIPAACSPPRTSPRHSPPRSPRRSPGRSPRHSPPRSPRRSPGRSPRHSPGCSPRHSPVRSSKNCPKCSSGYSGKRCPNCSSKNSTRSPRNSPGRSPRSPGRSPRPSPGRSPRHSPSRSPRHSPPRAPCSPPAPCEPLSPCGSSPPCGDPAPCAPISPCTHEPRSPLRKTAPLKSPCSPQSPKNFKKIKYKEKKYKDTKLPKKDCKTPPLSRTPSEISLVSPDCSPKESNLVCDTPSCGITPCSPNAPCKSSSSSSNPCSRSDSPRSSPLASLRHSPVTNKCSKSSTKNSVRLSSTDSPCRNCKCDVRSSGPRLAEFKCTSTMCPTKSSKTIMPPRAPPSSLKSATTCTEKRSKSCTCLKILGEVKRNQELAVSASDSKLTGTCQTLLLTAIDQLCNTVGQLSGQIRMLMTRMTK